MKTALLLLTLIFSVNLNAQIDTIISWTSYTPNYTSSWGDGDVPYLIGSYLSTEYKLETRVCSKDESIVLSNGRRIAGLSCILFEKEDYIGGNMIFGKDTTTITDMTVVPVGEGAEFTVFGKDFNMSFTLRSGMILRYENELAVFNTKSKGDWTIRKKV